MISVRIGTVAAVAVLALAACSNTGPNLATPPGASGSTTAQGMPGGTGSSTTMTVADQAFLTHAAHGGLAEVALGQLAQRRAGSATVREFGRRMVQDHTQANQELVALARAKGMTPPTAPDAGRQAVATALGSLEGANFDRQYMQQQLAEHEMAIALYDTQARGGTDPRVRSFAAKWLPALREHARMIGAMVPPTASLAR